jgi:hypothetical protein
MTNTVTLKERIAANAGRPCKIDGCGKPRYKGTSSPLCSLHRDRQQRLGHPLASSLPRRATQGARRFAKRILSSPANQDRTVLIDAVSAVKSRLTEAALNPRPTKLDRLLVSRSIGRKQEPIDILSSVAGVLLYLQAINPDPPELPDQKARDFCVARSWLMVDTQGENRLPVRKHASIHDPSSPALAELGLWCRTTLAPVVAALIQAWESAAHRRKPLPDPRRPFNIRRPPGSGRPRGV